MKTEFEILLATLFQEEGARKQFLVLSLQTLLQSVYPGHFKVRKTKSTKAIKEDNLHTPQVAATDPDFLKKKEALGFLTEEFLKSAGVLAFIDNFFNPHTTCPSDFFEDYLLSPLRQCSELQLSAFLDNTHFESLKDKIQKTLRDKSEVLPLIPHLQDLVQKFEEITVLQLQNNDPRIPQVQQELHALVSEPNYQAVSKRYRSYHSKNNGFFDPAQKPDNFNCVEKEELNTYFKTLIVAYRQFYEQPVHWAYVGDFFKQNPLKASYGFSDRKIFSILQKTSFEQLEQILAFPQTKNRLSNKFTEQVFLHSLFHNNDTSLQGFQARVYKFNGVLATYLKHNMQDKLAFIFERQNPEHALKIILTPRRYNEHKVRLDHIKTLPEALYALKEIFQHYKIKTSDNFIDRFVAELEKKQLEQEIEPISSSTSTSPSTHSSLLNSEPSKTFKL